MPQANHKSPLLVCPECAETFEAIDPRKVFCCPAHKKAYHNRDLAVGGSLVILAKAWRQGRHKKGSDTAKYAFSEFCLALDRAIAEDRAAGRVPALQVLHNRYRRQGISAGN